MSTYKNAYTIDVTATFRVSGADHETIATALTIFQDSIADAARLSLSVWTGEAEFDDQGVTNLENAGTWNETKKRYDCKIKLTVEIKARADHHDVLHDFANPFTDFILTLLTSLAITSAGTLFLSRAQVACEIIGSAGEKCRLRGEGSNTNQTPTPFSDALRDILKRDGDL